MISIIDENGQERFLGNNPSKLMSAWPTYGDVPETPMVPESKWLSYFKPENSDDDQFLSPTTDQNGVGQCFPKGTLVRMGDGSQKPIEDVKVLDKVLTAEGNVKEVLRTMVRHESEGVYRLHVTGHRHLRATAEHPVLTEKGYVKIADLKHGDMVAMPRYSPQTVKSITITDYYEGGRIRTSRAKAVRTIGIPGKKATTITRHHPPDIIHLTPGFGWILGLYLAEGSTDAGKVRWALSLAEAETHGARLVELLRTELGVEANLRLNPANRVTIITIYGVWWAKLFEQWGACGCAEKKLHPDLASGPKEFLQGVIDGWTDGDGLGGAYNGGVTTSHALAVGMYDIAAVLGLRPTVETHDVAINPKHNIKSRRRRYIVKWGKNLDREDCRSRQTATHVYRRVDGVVREDFAGWVFNLEVADDHSYVAEGIGVHNCNANAVIEAIEDCRNMAGLNYVQLSPADLYNRINGGRDQGSTLEDGMRVALASGVGTAATCGTVWKRGMKQASVEERGKYKVLQAWLCPEFDHIMSAVLCGFRVVTGKSWYSNYNTDSEGWLPNSGRGSAGGHATTAYAPAYRNGVFGVWERQSWGAWGYKKLGRFAVPRTLYNHAIGGHWAVRQVVIESTDVPVPKFSV